MDASMFVFCEQSSQLTVMPLYIFLLKTANSIVTVIDLRSEYLCVDLKQMLVYTAELLLSKMCHCLLFVL